MNPITPKRRSCTVSVCGGETAAEEEEESDFQLETRSPEEAMKMMMMKQEVGGKLANKQA